MLEDLVQNAFSIFHFSLVIISNVNIYFNNACMTENNPFLKNIFGKDLIMNANNVLINKKSHDLSKTKIRRVTFMCEQFIVCVLLQNHIS